MSSSTAPSRSPRISIEPEGWAEVNLQSRLYFLASVANNLKRSAQFWVEEEAELRGHTPTSEAGAESWLLGPLPAARTLRYLGTGLRSGGRPRLPSLRLRVDGRCSSRVFPFGFHEGVLFWGNQAHVWSIGSSIQGQEYRRVRETHAGPALVLGASNVSAIAITDTLSKLFCENRPVVCKLPERFAPLLPLFKELFYPLIRNAHLQFLCGDDALGQALINDPVFKTVHLTGSRDTYRKILDENRFEERSFTAELGCVTPAVLLPGDWTDEELTYQARHLASLMVFNGGYNCVTPQLVVVSRKWPQKEHFRDLLLGELERFQEREDRFPGSSKRRRSFRESYPLGQSLGPRTFVECDPQGQERLFQEESFCGMLGWVELDEGRPDLFVAQATEFVNRKVWGDLSCLLLVDPRTRRDYEKEIAHAVTLLEYGTVCINVWAGLAFASSVTPWGSYRGGNVETGAGWVHNTFFYDRPEKTVLEGPFLPFTPLPWLKPFPHLYRVGRALFELDLKPNTLGLLRYFGQYGRALWSLRHKREKA